MAKVLAIVEQRGGEIRRVSHEAVSAARGVADAVGGVVHAVAFGPPGLADAAGALGRFGAADIHVGEDAGLEQNPPDALAAHIARAIETGDYFAVIFPATSLGKEVAPRVAARLDLPLAADATALSVTDGELFIVRPVYAGRAFATVVLDATPRLVSIRPNIFRAVDKPAAGAVQRIDVEPVPSRLTVRERKAASGEIDVGEAAIVISGGRGMRGPEHWPLLEELRDAIGPTAALGASRAVVDAGWRPHAEQVGQTGKTVSPRLYFAVAISGAMQHLAGMRGAGTIVAINKDPDAPIFKIADYGLVGDAHEVLPRLADEIRKTRG